MINVSFLEFNLIITVLQLHVKHREILISASNVLIRAGLNGKKPHQIFFIFYVNSMIPSFFVKSRNFITSGPKEFFHNFNSTGDTLIEMIIGKEFTLTVMTGIDQISP